MSLSNPAHNILLSSIFSRSTPSPPRKSLHIHSLPRHSLSIFPSLLSPSFIIHLLHPSFFQILLLSRAIFPTLLLIPFPISSFSPRLFLHFFYFFSCSVPLILFISSPFIFITSSLHFLLSPSNTSFRSSFYFPLPPYLPYRHLQVNFKTFPQFLFISFSFSCCLLFLLTRVPSVFCF